MKVKRTRNTGLSKQQKQRATNKAPAAKNKDDDATPVGDVVNISADALSAAKVNEAKAVGDDSLADGKLPDPRATSQAILERELAAVFKEIYV